MCVYGPMLVLVVLAGLAAHGVDGARSSTDTGDSSDVGLLEILKREAGTSDGKAADIARTRRSAFLDHLKCLQGPHPEYCHWDINKQQHTEWGKDISDWGELAKPIYNKGDSPIFMGDSGRW